MANPQMFIQRNEMIDFLTLFHFGLCIVHIAYEIIIEYSNEYSRN